MKQKGFAHLFLILFLVAGLAVAVYLVQKKTNILPKAYEPNNSGIGSTASSSGCYARLGRFSVDKPCSEVEGGFRYASFDCLALAGGITASENQVSTQSIGTPETCKSIDDLVIDAKIECKSICNNINLSPTPPFTASPSATPAKIPAKPTNLRVRCDKPETWLTVFQWDQGDSNSKSYYVRYKAQNSTKWWPVDPNEGATTETFFQFDTEKAPVLDSWAVSVCNPNGCSDYAVGKKFSCDEFFK